MTEHAPSYDVLLKTPEDLRLPEIARALALFKKIPLQDAAPLARRCWGIVASDLGEPEARDLIARLEECGLGGLAVGRGSMRDLPPDQLVLRAEFSPETLQVFDKAGGRESLSWRRIEVVAAAVIRSVTSRSVEVKEGPTAAQKAMRLGVLMTTGLPIPIGKKRQVVEKKLEHPELLFYLDLITDAPRARYRIDAQQFDYSVLGARKLYNVMGNFKIVVGEIAARAPQAFRTRGTEVLMANQPLATLGYESLADLERECRWLLTLAAAT